MSPEIISLAVMLYVRFPLSLRNVEDLLHERGIEISHETVRFWWNRFGPMFAAEIRRNRVSRMRSYSNWQWHLDEVFVKINGETHYLWRAVDHEGEVLESYVTKRRDRKAALKFLRKAMKRYGGPEVVVTDKLRSYGAAMKVVGKADRQETGRWVNNRAGYKTGLALATANRRFLERPKFPNRPFDCEHAHRMTSRAQRRFPLISVHPEAQPRSHQNGYAHRQR